jgi:TPR repeat protein
MARACEAGQMRSCGELALLLRDGRGGGADPTAAARRAVQGCDGGDGAACVILGGLRAGDAPMVATALRRACKLGATEGCVQAASGAAAAGDDAGAFSFASDGCTLGDGQACAMAGMALQRGVGAPADPRAALARFTASCAASYAPGCTAGGLLGIELASKTVPPGRGAAARALRMLERACGLGERLACDVLSEAGATGAPSPPPP